MVPNIPQMDAKGVTLEYTYGDVGQASRLECIFERDVASSLDDTAGRLVKEGNKTYRYGYLDKVLSVIDGETTRTYTYHADGQLATASYGRADVNRSTVGRGDPTAPTNSNIENVYARNICQ